MNHILPRALALLSSLFLCVTSAVAADRLSERWDEKRATALLERAVQHVQARGETALADFSRQGEFVDRDLYVYVLNAHGRLLASGGSSAALIGQNVAERTDTAGKPFFREILDVAARDGVGRVEYRWLNPLENREEPKVSLFRKVGEYVVAVGFYAPRASADEARAMLARAAEALQADRAKALASFQDVGGRFIQDDLYVFAVDMIDGRFLAHGASPGLVSREGRTVQDPRGKAVITDMMNIGRSKGEGQLEYAWRNPLTGRVETKTSFFRVVDQVLLGVGYYQR